MSNPIGVGFIGAGFVTQAIHLPVLSNIPDRITVVRVVDPDAGIAEQVASRCGGVGSFDADDLLTDPEVQVVAVCSPDRFHAEQVIAACRAGKKAVLCEKPMAVTVDEAEAIQAVATQTGTALFVGTMHAYDPAYRAVLAAWQATGDQAQLIRSAIFLPGNDEFVDQATEVVRGDQPASKAPDMSPREYKRSMMRRAMLGLAIHNLPLVRHFQSEVGTVHSAEFLSPFGYALQASSGETMTELTAVMPGAWPHKWTFEVLGREYRLKVKMPPSFVMAGSAKADLIGRGEARRFHYDQNGYQALWLAIASTVEDRIPPPFSVQSMVSDLKFALDLADGADALIGADR